MKRIRILGGAVIGLIAGAVTGDVVGRVIVSDNLPFFIALGALVGVCIGLIATLIVERFKQRGTSP